MKRKNKRIIFYVLIPFLVIFFTTVLVFSFLSKTEYFSNLANSFLHGKTYFLNEPEEGSDTPWADTTLFNGNYFSPHGPFPAILLMPFVFIFNIFGISFAQSYLQPVLVGLVFFLVYKIAKKTGYDKEDSLFLSYSFCFSTVFLGSAIFSLFFAHTVVVALQFLFLWGYLNNSSLFLQGFYSSLMLITRTSTWPTVGLEILRIMSERGKLVSKRLSSLPKLLFFPALALALYFLYNWGRFGNFFEFGYSSAINYVSATKARDYGVLSIMHIPGNIYYFLLAPPLPIFKDGFSHVLTFPFIKANPWGMSVFLTSPIFIYLFFLSYKDKESRNLLLTIAVIVLMVFLYYGIGARQFGYRYSLDFLPLLFYLLLKNYKQKYGRLSLGFKIVALVSSITNLYFLITAFYYV